MAALSDFKVSMAFRDVMERLTVSVIDRERPRYRYATVVSIDKPNLRCEVQFQGEPSTVFVTMGSIQPNGIGDVVRVNGIGTDRFIEEVVGGGAGVGGGGGGVSIGFEMAWPGPVSTIPAGWKVEDGSQLLIASYPTLYDRLTNGGTTFPHGANTNGAGAAGTTHFRLPNRKGRTLVGQDSGQTEFDTIGETGGAKTHTLTTAEMPSHSHGLTQAYTTPGGTGIAGIVYTATSALTGPAGGGGSHNNLQPYAVGLWIIKASSEAEPEDEPAPTYADLATILRADAVATSNITLSGLQTIDSYSVNAGDIVLVTGQTSPAENGPYVVSTGTWGRHPLADTTTKLIGMEVVVERGAAYGGKRFTPIGWKATDTLGTTALSWTMLGDFARLLMPPVMLRATASPQLTTTLTAVEGLSHTFTVESAADTFDVNMVMDVGALNTASWIAVGTLFVDDVAQTGSCVVAGTTTNQRITSAQNHQITGLTPGTHTIEMRANKNGTPTVQLYAGHTSMSIKQVPAIAGEVAPIVLPASEWNATERGEVVKAKVAALGNIALSGTGQVIDGVTVQAGDIVLAPMQTIIANNGLYVAGSGAWTRHPAANTGAKLASIIVRVQYGNWHGGKTFSPDASASDIPGTNNIYFEELNNGLVQAQAWLAALNIPHATFTAMALPTVHDPYSMYNPANGTYTTPVRGLYRMTASAYFSVRAAAANHLLVTCNIAGGENMRWSAPGPVPGTGQGSGGTYTRALNAGTPIQFLMYQDGGGNMAANQLNHMVELARSY
jgi:microcystin-dependent protein